MIPFLLARKRRAGATLGVGFGRDGAAVARASGGGRDRPPRLDQAAWLPAADPVALARQLEAVVDDQGLARTRAVGVVAPGDYHVVQIETPRVPAAEMNQAAAWYVRDLIDMPLDQAVIETFEPPEAAQRGEPQTNVVVARRSVVDERAQLIRDAGLDLVALDIPELAQRNICHRLPAARGGHALLALDDTGGLLTVYRDGLLFLARSLHTGHAALLGEDAATIENLVLEVQRSFDYFESALAQPPLGALYIYPATAATERVAAEVGASLSGVDCRCIRLDEIADVASEPDPASERAPLLQAVGAALREHEVPA